MLKWPKLLCKNRLRTSESDNKEDHRSEFEKDYDRVVYCTPFRRLQDKAQVWPLEPNDAVHTRLAHSIEVARTARGLTQRVAANLVDKQIIYKPQARSLATLAETCGLIHDFGNPPFGHAGEEAIKAWFQQRLLKKDFRESKTETLKWRKENLTSLGKQVYGIKGEWNHDPDRRYVNDFLCFDGNPQTIRLITHLQVVADYYGLNLTAATLAAVQKYRGDSQNRDSSSGDHTRSKLGYLQSEKDVVQRSREMTGTEHTRHPITVLVEAADDIVYSTVDLEDARRKGVITWNDVKTYLRDHICTQSDARPALDEVIESAKDRVKRGDANLKGDDEDEARMLLFRTYMIGRHVAAVNDAFERHYESIMNGDYTSELLYDSKTGAIAKACKKMNRERVITSNEIGKLEYMGRTVMHDLMDMFWEGARNAPNDDLMDSFQEKMYQLMSANYRSVFEHAQSDDKKQPEEPPAYARLQLVADYVCGMTDTYACQLHRELTNG